jgi:diguanylate cyclase (GGDEF)-like protein/PAS domain S-box-containing protein
LGKPTPPMKKYTFFQRVLVPLLLLGIVAFFSTAIYMFTLNMQTIEKHANTEANELTHLLRMAKTLVEERVSSSMQLLKQNSAQLGKPEVVGSISLNDEVVPNLMLGNHAISKNYSLVDGVTSIGSGTATIFVKSDQEFIRVTTNIQQKNFGHVGRAIGTRLDPNGRAIANLKQGKPFYGVVDILGEPYISGYEPIFDEDGQVIGAWYVGYKVDVQALDQAIKKWSYLNTGFAAIVDYNNNIRFVSEDISKEKATYIFEKQPTTWKFVEKNIPDWNFRAYIAYPKREAYLSSINNLYPLLILGGLFGAALLLLALGVIKRFVLTPLGGDPETASALVSRIAQGNLDDDKTRAKADTLIGNMLIMRSKLREMVTEIKDNADSLRVSSSVFEHAHDGIFITDSQANILDVNPAFTQVTGYTKAESLGKTPDQLGFAHDIDDFFAQFFASTDYQGEWQGEVWSKNKSGNTYLAKLDLFPVHAKTGEFQHYVGLFSDITQDKEQHNLLEHQAYHDPLTQLPNRLRFTQQLQQAVSELTPYNKSIAICYIDLDNFKPINDKHGHETGDRLLVLLAKRLENSLGHSDTVARLGGDEFALLLKGRNNVTEYQEILTRLLIVIEQPFLIKNQTFTISASIGYTIAPDDNNPPDILLRHADNAMYHAKTHGGRHFHLFDLQLAQLSRNQHQLEKDIRRAIKNHEFILFFQPQINIQTGLTVGMEALIRWRHPTQGILLPGTFLPLIENTSLMIDIGEWVIQQALAHIEHWNQQGLNFYVAVNIAANHIAEKDFAAKLSLALQQHPTVYGNQLSLEITESAAINDFNHVSETMNQCKKLGVSFAIDDFGAGYSSLIYLRRLPVDTIKIDRSFIHDMLHDPEDLAVVTSIITLCKEFNRGVIAEGIETLKEAEKLAELGCFQLQGFGISKPMPFHLVTSWFKANTPFKFSAKASSNVK